jgi:hypothetical protein
MVSVSESDEAITRFFLNVWLPKIEDWFNKGCNNVPDEKIGNGSQDLKKNGHKYIKLCDKIASNRSDVNLNLMLRWNTLFWNEVEKRHTNMYKEKEVYRYNTNTIKLTLPKPDTFNKNLFAGITTIINIKTEEKEDNDYKLDLVSSAKNVEII